MADRATRSKQNLAEYYDRRKHTLDDLSDEQVDFSLTEELKKDIHSGKRRRRLQNISIKLDPVQIQAIRKIATMKSIPYQTFIRHWLSECIKREFLSI